MESDAVEALAVLAWFRAMGVDETVGEVPLSWRNDPAPVTPAKEARKPVPPQTLSSPLKPLTSPAVNHPDSGERPLASSAKNLDELLTLLQTFDGCALRKTAKKLCLYRGSPSARIMFVGEAPGKEEDAQGIPFVGPAGRLLDRMLASISLGSDDVFITNLVFWKPPGNRTPSLEEVQACRPFLDQQIELVRPEIIISLGGAAAKELSGVAETIGKLRGRWLPFPPATNLALAPKTMAIFHPAYLLRNPIAKRQAWRDLLTIRDALDRSS